MIQNLLRKNPSFRRSISVTTRSKRPQETSGRDYYFVSTVKFRRMVKEKALVEWAEVYGNWYGTPKSLLERAHKHGWTVLLSLDVQGALTIKKNYPGSVLIFLSPPSWRVLKQRLTRRDGDSHSSLRLRLKNARQELKNWKKYDYLVVNQNLRQTIEQIECILKAERNKTLRIQLKQASLPPLRG